MPAPLDIFAVLSNSREVIVPIRVLEVIKSNLYIESFYHYAKDSARKTTRQKLKHVVTLFYTTIKRKMSINMFLKSILLMSQ